MPIIRNGTIIMIYHDPLTKKNKEGVAMVMELIMQSDSGIGLYLVHFVKDDHETVVQRWIAGDELTNSAQSLSSCSLSPPCSLMAYLNRGK